MKSILDGLKTKAASDYDKSMERKGGNVGKDTTRTTTGEEGDSPGPGPRV